MSNTTSAAATVAIAASVIAVEPKPAPSCPNTMPAHYDNFAAIPCRCSAKCSSEATGTTEADGMDDMDRHGRHRPDAVMTSVGLR